MPTYSVNGMVMTLTEQQAANIRATRLMNVVEVPPAPAPIPTMSATTGRTLGRRIAPAGGAPAGPSTRTPCEVYEAARKAGQSAAILDALNRKCLAFKEAQQFAAPLSPNDPAVANAQQFVSEEMAQAGMSKGMKIALIAGGALVVVGGIAWYVSRR